MRVAQGETAVQSANILIPLMETEVKRGALLDALIRPYPPLFGFIQQFVS